MAEQNKRVITHLIPMDEKGGLQDPVYFLVNAEEIFIDTPEGEKLLTEVLNNIPDSIKIETEQEHSSSIVKLVLDTTGIYPL